MNKLRVDKTSRLFAWLDANAKIVAQPEDMANGSGKETIFAVPLSKEKEFERLFYSAYANRESVWDDGGPAIDETWDVVTGNWEAQPGPYAWRKRGCDFDGFYEHGVSGTLECLRYWTFREATVYWMNTWPENVPSLQISIDAYADGTLRMLYAVCIVDDTNKENKENPNDETK